MTNWKKILKPLLLAFLFTAFIATEGFAAKWARPSSGYFFIKSVQAGKSNSRGFWDQPGKPKRYKKGANIGIWSKDRKFNRDQQFRVRNAGGGWYYIRSRNGGYVDVDGNKNGNGVNIHVWKYNRSDAQKFRFKYLGRGKWKIYTNHGRILALKGRSHKNGSNVHTWADHNGKFTEWYFVSVRNGILKGPKSRSKSTISINKALRSKQQSLKEKYFKNVSSSQFRRDDRKMLKFINDQKSASSQWKNIVAIAQATVKNNNARVRRSVYRYLNKVKLKKPNFFEKATRKSYAQKIGKVNRKEKNYHARKILVSIGNKIEKAK